MVFRVLAHSPDTRAGDGGGLGAGMGRGEILSTAAML